MRRRARIEDKLEKLSVGDALEAIRFAEVVVVLMDAQAAFEEQDLRLADLVEREGRALVLGFNKWDLKDDPAALRRLRDEADHWLPQVKGVPVVALSGLTGQGIDRLMQAIVDIHVLWNKRVPTNPLNRWLEAHARSASAAGGLRPAAQAQLHHATKDAAAEFRHFLHPRRCRAGCLSALSGQRAAR